MPYAGAGPSCATFQNGSMKHLFSSCRATQRGREHVRHSVDHGLLNDHVYFGIPARTSSPPLVPRDGGRTWGAESRYRDRDRNDLAVS